MPPIHSGTGTEFLFFQSPSGAVNISTRLDVGLTDDVLIGGFIVTGNAPKKVIIRAIGPSLPVVRSSRINPRSYMTLRALGSNDNWRYTQEEEIVASTVAPTNDLESAIVGHTGALGSEGPGAGPATVVVSGKNGFDQRLPWSKYVTSGTASLDVSSLAKLANISTRGNVRTADDVMIGGFIVGGNAASNILVRAIGPELTTQGVAGALQDTTLDSVMTLVEHFLTSNDDWESDQKGRIIDTTIPPTDPRESAIVATLDPATHTAIPVRARITLLASPWSGLCPAVGQLAIANDLKIPAKASRERWLK